ncbi:DUF4349 domain-containing protein [Agromyces aurantiacus]|uniref:DUF4349 domain-containing protein n=1 Tax=Agromyces aurantiacus TaxID=165814 RepID=A0ABV9QZS7_9MICO|nr:DUF4349 domain-containing protein [Agromyces aurantiacus]MBM7505474.1 hypothetical protein [Agromyces aurantiacus]
MTRRRAHLAAAAAATLALLLSGCSMGSGSSSGGDSVAPQPDVGVEAPDQGVAGGEGLVPEESVDEGRSVITTGWLTLTVDDPIASASEAVSIVDRAGGRIDSRSETPGTDTQQARATLVVRIPSEDFDAVLGDLRELGDVDSVQLDASDVTQQREDLDARIGALQASVDRLLALLQQASTTEDLIAIESALSSRQAELDSLTAQRDLLVDQVEYSTLTVELLSEGIAPEAGPDDFWSGVAAGWDALVAFASGLLVVVGVLLPWLAVLLVIAAIVAVIVILATRRRHHVGPDRPEDDPGRPTHPGGHGPA